MKSRWGVSLIIVLHCLNVLGMEKDKNILSLIQSKKDHKTTQNLSKELKKCEKCDQYSAKGYCHRYQSDINGFLCVECTNKRAYFLLDMALGPCADVHANKDTKK